MITEYPCTVFGNVSFANKSKSQDVTTAEAPGFKSRVDIPSELLTVAGVLLRKSLGVAGSNPDRSTKYCQDEHMAQ